MTFAIRFITNIMRKVVTSFQLKIHDDEAGWWSEIAREAKRRGWPVSKLVRATLEVDALAYRRTRIEAAKEPPPAKAALGPRAI